MYGVGCFESYIHVQMLSKHSVILPKHEQGQTMSYEKSKEPAYSLDAYHMPCQPVLAHGPHPDQPQIEDRQVSGLHDQAIVLGEMDQTQRMQDLQADGEK